MRWLSKKVLLILQEESLAHFGGARGVRDEGLLDSALARPENIYAHQPESSIADLAAAYGYGLIKNHPFVDGNKRVGFLAIGLFLSINGYELVASQPNSIETILDVASGALDEQALKDWILRNSKPT